MNKKLKQCSFSGVYRKTPYLSQLRPKAFSRKGPYGGNKDHDIKIVFIISPELVPVQTPKNLKFCRFCMSFGVWVYKVCRFSHLGKK